MNFLSPLALKGKLFDTLHVGVDGSFRCTPNELLAVSVDYFATITIAGAEGESLLFEWSAPLPNYPEVQPGYNISIHRQFFVITLPDGSESPEPEACWSLGGWLQFSPDALKFSSAAANIRCGDPAEAAKFAESVRVHPIFSQVATLVPTTASAFLVVSSGFDPEVLLGEGRVTYLQGG